MLPQPGDRLLHAAFDGSRDSPWSVPRRLPVRRCTQELERPGAPAVHRRADPRAVPFDSRGDFLRLRPLLTAGQDRVLQRHRAVEHALIRERQLIQRPAKLEFSLLDTSCQQRRGGGAESRSSSRTERPLDEWHIGASQHDVRRDLRRRRGSCRRQRRGACHRPLHLQPRPLVPQAQPLRRNLPARLSARDFQLRGHLHCLQGILGSAGEIQSRLAAGHLRYQYCLAPGDPRIHAAERETMGCGTYGHVLQPRRHVQPAALGPPPVPIENDIARRATQLDIRESQMRRQPSGDRGDRLQRRMLERPAHPFAFRARIDQHRCRDLCIPHLERIHTHTPIRGVPRNTPLPTQPVQAQRLFAEGPGIQHNTARSHLATRLGHAPVLEFDTGRCISTARGRNVTGDNRRHTTKVTPARK